MRQARRRRLDVELGAARTLSACMVGRAREARADVRALIRRSGTSGTEDALPETKYLKS